MGHTTKNAFRNRLCLSVAALGLIMTACATPGETIATKNVVSSPPAEAPSAIGSNEPGRVFSDYRGAPEIVRGAGDGGDMVRGAVFEDLNRNSMMDEGEPGLSGVMVSNGRDVAKTVDDGSYVLPARDDMSVFVIQPTGYQVPHDKNWVPQFAYEHKPAGTPKTLRYGGLPATGPLPEAINFPLIEAGAGETFGCAVLGDTQTYANQDISFFRDSTVDDILDTPADARPGCILAVGDVMGDDLFLIPRMAEVISVLEAPQWWVHGNHDFDFDADFDEDSADSWRNLHGPAYYAYEIGDVMFIVLDNVVYPCSREDAERAGRESCIEDDRKRYNGRVTDDQMLFVEGVIEGTDPDKLIVFAHHIPFVSFADRTATAHQTDNVTDIYALVEGRAALSLSGHTHTMENMNPGEVYAGWSDAVGVDALPFRHIIAGAASGAWYNGDFDTFGVPMALQRLGAPRGWLDLRFEGVDYVETYFGSNLDTDQRMWVSVNTPGFRTWFDEIMAWHDLSWEERDPLPPLNINDLPDVKILTPEDLADDSYITVNVWAGTTDTQVTASIDGQELNFIQTQQALGEETKMGAEWADPFATQRQLMVARWAFESRSGEERNQGWEAYKGSSFGPAAPQPQFSIANRSSHLWRARLPADLPMGVHPITVTSIDRHGRQSQESIIVEVRAERPQMRFDSEHFFAFEDGAPVRPEE